MQKQTLKILATENKENIPELLQNIGSIPTAWEDDYTMPIFDEFNNQNLMAKVKDPTLKQLLLELKEMLIRLDGLDDYITAQYNTLIEPYFAKNINYAQTALPPYKKGLVKGGPDTNFEMFFNSMELWNITTFKLETTNSNIDYLHRLRDLLDKLKSALKNEFSK